MTETLISRWIAVDDMEIHRVNRKAREVTAYATFFAQPAEIRDKHGHYWEEINRSAFNRAISYGIGRVQVFYNHGRDLTGRPNILGAVPIATPTTIKPDGRGLLTVARYNDSELSDAILSAWNDGQIKGQSFSGRVFKDRDRGQREGLKHVERMELGLKEFGPTHSPAYEGDGLVMMRSELEEVLRAMLPSLINTSGTPSEEDPLEVSGNASASGSSGSGTEDEDSAAARLSIAKGKLTLKRRRLDRRGDAEAS